MVIHRNKTLFSSVRYFSSKLKQFLQSADTDRIV